MNPESHSFMEAMAPPCQPRDPDASREKSSSYGLLDSLRRRFRLAAVLAALSGTGCFATVRETKRYNAWEETGKETEIRTIKTPPKVFLETAIRSSEKGPILFVHASQYGEYQTVKTVEEEEIEYIEQEGNDIGMEYAAAGGACIGGILLVGLAGASSPDKEEIERAEGERKKELEKKSSEAGGLGLLGFTSVVTGLVMLGHATYKAIEAIDEEDETGRKRLHPKILNRKPYQEVLAGAPILLRTSRGNFSLGTTNRSGGLRVDLKTAIQERALLAIIDQPVYVVADIRDSAQPQLDSSDWYNPKNPFEANPDDAEFIDACEEAKRKTRVQIIRILQYDSSPSESRYRVKVTLEDGRTVECGATGEQLNLSAGQREAIIQGANEFDYTAEEVKKWKQIRFEARLKSREIAQLDLKQIFLSPEEREVYEKYQNEKDSEKKVILGLQFLNGFPGNPANKSILAWIEEHAKEHFFGTAAISKTQSVRCQRGDDYQLQAGAMVFVDSAWSSFDQPELATMLKIIPTDGACSILLTDKDDLSVVRDLRNFSGSGGKFTISKPTPWQLLRRTSSEIDAHLSELGLAGLDTGEIFQRLVRWIIKHGSSTTASSSAADSAIITKGDFPKILCADSLTVEHLPIKDGDLQKCDFFGYSCVCGSAPCNLPVGPGTYKVTLKRTGCGPRREEKYEVKIGPGEIMTVTPPW